MLFRSIAAATTDAADRAVPGADAQTGGGTYAGPPWSYEQVYTLHRPGPNAITVYVRYDAYDGGATGTVGVLGGVVLAWMGWGIISAAWRDLLDPPAVTGTTGAGLALVRAGLLSTVGNPYWLLWWLTVGASYFIAFHRFGLAALIALFYLGQIGRAHV